MPLRHGHAISIDMAYSATLANQRKLLSDEEHRRILNLFSRAGLSMDHHQFDEEILEKATAAILKTRDGKLRAAVPNPLGSCTFLNDVSAEEIFNHLVHETLAESFSLTANSPLHHTLRAQNCIVQEFVNDINTDTGLILPILHNRSDDLASSDWRDGSNS
ncbi:3-dehydroquinate synthase family protein [Bacillus velezensis]|uniref:3-dehydroquinate synthase family protein n=1 Tax=Bacillus velezensis TaxID=492670 RepID=UPI003C6CC130